MNNEERQAIAKAVLDDRRTNNYEKYRMLQACGVKCKVDGSQLIIT